MPEQNLANLGTESFDLKNLETNKAAVTINIEEDSADGIILENFKEEKNKSLFAKANDFFANRANVNIKQKATFFHLLAVMINSGIPMIKALKSLKSQMKRGSKMAKITDSLRLEIESGNSLSKSMVFFKDTFTEAEIGMVKSGEASGQLSKVLANLAKDTEKSYMIRRKIKGAMIYPAVILSLLVIVVTVMMVFVVPQLSELFSSLGSELPQLTQIVIGLSEFINNNIYGLILAFAALVLGLYLFVKTSLGRFLWDSLKLKLPIFGPLLKKGYLARFTRSLSNLLDSNVSIVQTLEISANALGNEVYRRRLILAAEDIKQGIPLAENLTESALFPQMLVNMIEVGEKTANLHEITAKIANFYEEEVDTSVNSITKIIEPLILIIVGISVGTVVAAIMLPILQLSSIV
jgi:type IV pilus assembly protein PilC